MPDAGNVYEKLMGLYFRGIQNCAYNEAGGSVPYSSHGMYTYTIIYIIFIL